MNEILTYPEQRLNDSAPGSFDRAVEFLVNRVGLDNALDLLTCLLEAL
jgi:hypothetical protein